MATIGLPFIKIALTDGQKLKNKVQNVFAKTSAVTLRVRLEQIRRIHELLLTSAQIKQMKKAAGEKKGTTD